MLLNWKIAYTIFQELLGRNYISSGTSILDETSMNKAILNTPSPYFPWHK